MAVNHDETLVAEEWRNIGALDAVVAEDLSGVIHIA